MMNDGNKLFGDSDIPRRRGRPVGKNRVPLSREERRARNAEYERQRRNETAEVMSQLAEAAGCDPNISHTDLLATVISRIERASRNHSDDITDLNRINDNLEAQIATLQERLGLDDEAMALLDADDTVIGTADPDSRPTSRLISVNRKRENYGLKNQRKKRKRSARLSSESIRPNKRCKTHSETCSVDSGVGMRSHTISPPTMFDKQTILQNHVQYLEPSESQLPQEMTEEQDNEHCKSQTHIQIYDSVSSVESISPEEVSQFIASLMASETIPSMENLSCSLIVESSIVAPQQETPDCQDVLQSDSSLSNFGLVDDRDFVHQNVYQEPTLEFLTDSHKGLLSDVWMGAGFIKIDDCESSQMQERNYNIGDDILTGY